MQERITRKDFPGLKEMLDGHLQWLIDYGWSPEYAWHDKPHASCKCTHGGKWKLQSYGHYLASDWNHRLYQSHRCSKCGVMVQHNQICDKEGKPQGLIMRLVIIQ